MKVLVIALFCCLLSTTIAEVNVEAARQSRERLKQAHEKCQSDPVTAIDENALKAARHGGAAPANSGPHALCISKSLGWQNEDGTVNRANIEKGASAIYGNNPELQRIVDECAVAKGTPEETAGHIFGCYRKHAPHSESSHDHDGHHNN